MDNAELIVELENFLFEKFEQNLKILNIPTEGNHAIAGYSLLRASVFKDIFLGMFEDDHDFDDAWKKTHNEIFDLYLTKALILTTDIYEGNEEEILLG